MANWKRIRGRKVQSLKKPRGGSQRRAFTVEELKALLKKASGEWKGQILFGNYTDERLGDIAQLCWDGIDLEKKIPSLSILQHGHPPQPKLQQTRS